MKRADRLITFMIITEPRKEVPKELVVNLTKRGWQPLRQNQVYALLWDQVLAFDSSDADRLMDRVLEIHKIATQLGVGHVFKTIKTSLATLDYPELL